MAERGRVGVVTVTYNSAEVLPDFLRSMDIQRYRDFLLFATDNGSKDKTVELLRSHSDARLKVMANAENVGVAEGNNQGIRAALEAGCDSILLLNNDTVFDEGLVGGLVHALAQHECDMVCSKIMYFDEPERIWAAGGMFQRCLGYRAKHIGEGEIDRGQHQTARRIAYVPTCCVLIRREVFSDVGTMDARYFVYVDDVDFMFRAMKAGKRLVYVPHLKLLHKVGGLTGGEESSFAIHYGTRNRLFFLLKSFGLVRSVPWMIVCQAGWLGLLVSRKKKAGWFRLKQEAFRSSLKMWAGKDRPEAG